jgi:hypothetical protein
MKTGLQEVTGQVRIGGVDYDFTATVRWTRTEATHEDPGEYERTVDLGMVKMSCTNCGHTPTYLASAYGWIMHNGAAIETAVLASKDIREMDEADLRPESE